MTTSQAQPLAPSSSQPANQQATSGSQPANTSQLNPALPTPQAAKAPDWLPETFWDPTKNEIKGADLRKRFDELTASDAAAAVRRNSVPAAEAYRAELPKELKLPEGVGFKFDDADPIMGSVLREARRAANEWGLDQAGFSRLLGLHAAARTDEALFYKNAAAAEDGKLGVNGHARRTAVETFIEAKFGEAAAKAIMVSLPLASQVEVWENVIKAMTSTGPGFNNGHRTPEPVARVDDATYSGMSYGEKKAYTARFPQQQNGA